MSEPVKTVPVPEALLRGVLDYLMTRPWREVNVAVPALLAVLDAEAKKGNP